MEKEKMQAQVEQFMGVYRSDKNSRYRSYDYAYKIYAENRGKTDAETLDYVALNVFAFLGSWGMLARGSFLLQKDYKFLIPVIKKLNKKEYDGLFHINPLAEDFNGEKFVKDIKKIVQELREYFQGEKRYDLQGELTDIKKTTDTVIGKILMVTLGCLPAYDRYVKIGMKAERVSGTIGEKSSRELIGYCKDNKTVLEQINRQCNNCFNQIAL